MGDVGNFWRDVKQHRQALRNHWHSCPECARLFGTGTKVPPGQTCWRHGWVAPGNKGDDVRAVAEEEKQARIAEEIKIAERKTKQAARKAANALRRCPHCKVLLKDIARKEKHIVKVHGETA